MVADVIATHNSWSDAGKPELMTTKLPTTGTPPTPVTPPTFQHVRMALEYPDGNQDTPSLITVPGSGMLEHLLRRPETPLLTEAARRSLVDQVYTRRVFTKRKSWSTKTKTSAVAYTAAEVYSNLDSIATDLLAFTPEPRVGVYPLPRVKAAFGVPDNGILQNTYDAIFLSTVGIDYTADSQLVESGDLHFNIGDVVIDSGAELAEPARFDTLQPVLHTMIASRRPMSQTELLAGFQKRNANVPRISSGLLPPALADTAYDNFIASVIGDVDTFATYADLPIAICEARFDE